jgi:4-aminobutyrate--pyruvate transaminase
MAESLEELILAEGPETCAAFFAEPVQGAGGVIVPPPTYFEKIQAVLKKYDLLFVADEVICGFGRTGNRWGSETFDLKPDMLTCAKALSASYMPISALMISEAVFEAMVAESEKIGIFGHGYTYSGHPVTTAVALETLKIYEERDILGHVRAVSPYFQSKMGDFADHPLVGDVSGVGLLAGLEIVRDKRTRESFDPAVRIGERIQGAALRHGLISRALGDRLALCPPLIIGESHVDEIAGAVKNALDEVWSEVRPEGLAAAD